MFQKIRKKPLLLFLQKDLKTCKKSIFTFFRKNGDDHSTSTMVTEQPETAFTLEQYTDNNCRVHLRNFFSEYSKEKIYTKIYPTFSPKIDSLMRLFKIVFYVQMTKNERSVFHKSTLSFPTR